MGMRLCGAAKDDLPATPFNILTHALKLYTDMGGHHA